MGRIVFGAASMLLGIACLALHDQLLSAWQLPGDGPFLVVTSSALIAGGLAIQFARTARIGAGMLACVWSLFAITFVPGVIAEPKLFATWGNVFYPLASVSGAVIVVCLASSRVSRVETIGRIAVVLFGLCNASFAAEQIEYVARSASLVPTWVPLGGMFWAYATAIAFGLAAVALVSSFQALLAARLTALMLASFGVLIWIPILIADPKTHSNWSEGLETFGIAGAAWIVAEFLNPLRASGRLPFRSRS